MCACALGRAQVLATAAPFCPSKAPACWALVPKIVFKGKGKSQASDQSLVSYYGDGSYVAEKSPESRAQAHAAVDAPIASFRAPTRLPSSLTLLPCGCRPDAFGGPGLGSPTGHMDTSCTRPCPAAQQAHATMLTLALTRAVLSRICLPRAGT